MAYKKNIDRMIDEYQKTRAEWVANTRVNKYIRNFNYWYQNEITQINYDL